MHTSGCNQSSGLSVLPIWGIEIKSLISWFQTK